MSSVPTGWTESTIGEATDNVVKHRPEDRPEEEFSYIDISSIDNAKQRITMAKRLIGRDAPSRARQLVRAGDTVLSTVRTYLKNTAMVPPALDGATASTGFTVLRPRPHVDPRFLFYRVLESGFVNHLSERQTGTSYPAVREKDVRAMAFSVPSWDEQQQIVEVIEEQFSRLDAGVDSLQRARRNLARLRASILKAAYDGPWELRALGDLAAREPRSITDGPFGSNLKTSHYTTSGPRVVRLQNIGDGRFQDDKAHISAEHFARLQNHAVEAGDVLIASLGTELPRACIAPDSLGPAIVKADCIRFRPGPTVEGRFVSHMLNSSPIRRGVSEIIHGVGRPRLNLREVKAIEIPVPALEEQHQIVAEVERQFSFIDAMATTIDTGLQRANALRQSILSQAFRGRLIAFTTST